MAREQLHMGDLLPLLESSDLRQVEDVKGLIRDHLNADRGAVLVNSLVDYYLETGSTEAMHILSSVREPHDKHLLDKMNECMASRACRLHTLTLLGHVVRKEPSWIHKIARFPLLLSLLKCLKTDTDALVLITGVLVLIILLPMIPQPGKQQLYEFFDIFGRLAAWNLKSAGRVTEVYLIHLHASVYSLFHRLYGMYPCNFISYLRSHYSMKENMDTFEEVVKPMLEHVRIHPELVTGTQDHELDPTRWKRYEIHDIVIECAKVSLDPKEASCEEGYSSAPDHFSAPQPLRHLDCTSSPYADFHSSCGSSSSTLFSNPRQALTSLSGMQPPYRSPQGSRRQIGELNNSCGLKDPFWTPASVCGMTTPPPSRSISPAGIAESSRSSSHFPGRVHGTLGSGKGTPLFSTPVAATPPPTLSDVFSNASRSSGTSSPPHKNGNPMKDFYLQDNRSLEYLKPGLVRQEPISEQQRSHMEAVETGGDSSDNIPMTLTELSSFVEEQQSAEQEEDALMQELLKITEDPPQLPSQWGLDSPFCHTTETLTGSQAPGPVALGPSLSQECHAEVTSATDRPEGAPDLFTPIDCPMPSQRSPPAPEDEAEAPSKAVIFSPSPFGAATPSYEALFDLALPKAAPHFVRRRTSEALRRAGAEEGEEAGPGPSIGPPMPPSPLEVLDRLIQQGKDAHDKALKRLPLPSKSADWTHFGGSAPLDELHTLRSQLLLLHNQLLYERYKREQHAVRNRRLLRRIIKATALEEQNSAMKDQLNLQNMDILSLKESLQVEQQRYHQLWEDREAVVTRLHSQIRQLQQGRDEYYTKNQELQSKLLECQKMTGKLEAELQKASNTVCNMGHQLSQLSIKLTTSESMQQQMAFLNKQLLLLGEVNKLCMEELQHSGSDTSKEQQMLLASSDKELERLRLSLVTQAQRLEVTQQRIGDLEAQLTKKEHLVVEQKKFLEDVKAQAKGELQASESRYQAQKRVTQALQTELLQLYSRLEMESPTTGGSPVPAGGAVQPHSLSVPRMDGDHTSLLGSKVKTGEAPQDRVDVNSPAATPHRGNISTLLSQPTPGSVNGGGGCPPAWVEPPPPWGSPGAPPPMGSCPTSGSFLDMRAQELLHCKSESPWDVDPRRLAGLSQGLKTEMCVEPPGPAWGPHTREARPDVLRANSRDGPISGPGTARQRKQELRIMDYDETHHEHS